MATVGTSTQSNLLSYPTVPSIVREMSTQAALSDIMYVALRTAADTISIYRSTNEGGSWASYSSFTHTGLQEWSSPYLDRFGGLHMAYRINTGTADVVYYRRMLCSTGAWSAAVQASATDANGGVAGSRWQGLDLVAVRNSSGSTSIAICGAYAQGSTQYGMTVMGLTITAGGQVSSNNSLIINNRFFFDQGTYPGYSTVACEVEHNGDGITASTPHLWVVWGRTKLRMVKLAWQGSSVGWTGPSAYQTIAPVISAHNFVGGRWDGKQWLMCTASPDDATMVRVYQRNQANTLTTTYDTLTHPTGNITASAMSYDNITKNIRCFAVGTSTSVLYYCDYSRTGGIWGSWSTVVATAVLGGTEWSVRRGGSADNSKIDVLTTASGSPNTVTHTGQGISTVPRTATWIDGPFPRYNGGPADVGATLPLNWNFSDPDPGQTQGSYAISRQIGAGTLAYYRASDQTWQVAEVQNTSTVSSVTIPASWGADADAQYTFKVKVWDSSGTPALSYSDPYVLIPSSPVNPSFTAPGSGATITTDKVTVSWTAAQQRGYLVTINTNPATVVQYTSGTVMSTDTSLTVPVSLTNGGSYTISLTTLNNELLPSAAQTRNFSVLYTPPPPPYPTFSPQPSLGYIAVTSAANAVVGAQVAIDSLALYRRPAVSPILNPNSDLTSNITGYVAGGGFGTISWSNAQAAPTSPGGSARLVPNGSYATPQVESPMVTIDPAKTYMGSAWIRPDTANKPIFIGVNFFTSGNVYITSKSIQLSPPVATAWQYLEVMADASTVPTAAKASISIGENTTPAVGDAFYADDLRLEEYDTTTGVRVATGLGHPATVNDWGAASSIAYEYRWVAVGTNGSAIAGPWIS